MKCCPVPVWCHGSSRPQPVIITLHGEAKAVLQDIGAYEQTQETLALLKMLALTGKAVDDGKVRPAAEAFAGIRERMNRKARP